MLRLMKECDWGSYQAGGLDLESPDITWPRHVRKTRDSSSLSRYPPPSESNLAREGTSAVRERQQSQSERESEREREREQRAGRQKD